MEIKAQVEILMTTYNGSRYLNEQLDSIINQSYTNWHLTISDDKSNDDTIDIIDSYISRHPNKIKRVDSGKHFGNARDHFFWLMKQCNSDYLMLSDQDDVWLDNKIELSINELLRLEKQVGKNTPILVFTDQKVVDEKLNVINDSLMRYQKQNFSDINYKKLLFQNVITGCTVCMNNSLLKQVNKVNTYQDIIMHDYWLGLVASRFGKLSYIDNPTMLYRQHLSNSVGAKNNSGVSFFINKISNLKDVKDNVVQKKKQAILFKNTYSDLLNTDDELFIDNMSKRRSGIFFYIKNITLFNTFFRWVGSIVFG